MSPEERDLEDDCDDGDSYEHDDGSSDWRSSCLDCGICDECVVRAIAYFRAAEDEAMAEIFAGTPEGDSDYNEDDESEDCDDGCLFCGYGRGLWDGLCVECVTTLRGEYADIPF